MRTAAVLWRSAHPGPTLVVSAIVAALGVAAGLDAARLAVLTAAVLCGQLSIGLSNDAIDAPRDRANSRRDKPLARPGAPIRAAWTAAFATAGLAVVLSAVLGWPVTAAHIVFIGCGWAYNAALKSTPWSVACFVVGFGVVPSLAPLALPDPAVAPAWAWIAGAALGVAVHFSNVLPDLEDDARTGVRGLPHRLGRRLSTVMAFATLLLGAGAALVGSAVQEGRVAPVTWTVAGAVAILVVGGAGAALVRAPDRMSFRIVMLAGLLLAVQLVIGTWAR
ncbi:1,4-dihydroxy-2-naphthoate prenyltransferase [Microbacterium sp. SYP-A9085]|uniref:UbiA family prenyltransferase n=1 Tax=Microbacterium sp. SYP-A9085 TaxID=2664454 RepID=UPI00129A8B74|nr:UbiA family prenyltransferase [Microbacterium sp. SYP-A9085]MRH29395.1 1,4-dihydroxy-2-naphthoate prenyltransferase [Microbacterium sp. SYP-A9085]